MTKISITNLLLRTQVGFNSHELDKLQDVVLNIDVEYRLQGEEISDNPSLALDYRTLCKDISSLVERKKFNLLETIANDVINYLIAIDRIKRVTVKVDKPHALRFAESVSITMFREKLI